MWDKFTDQAKRVLTLGREEARRLNHNYLGTEHLLLGLLAEGEGIAAKVLSSWGIDLGYVRAKVEELIGRGGGIYLPEMTLTPRAKRALELAYEESMLMGQDYIGTEHILLGLIREGEGVAAKILESLGVTLDKARNDVVSCLLGVPFAWDWKYRTELIEHYSKIFSLLETFKGRGTDNIKSEIEEHLRALIELLLPKINKEREAEETIEQLKAEIEKLTESSENPYLIWVLSPKEIKEAIELGKAIKDDPSAEDSWSISSRGKKIEILTPFRRLALASKEASKRYKELTKEEIRQILRDMFLSIIVRVTIEERGINSKDYYCVIKIDDKIIHPEKIEPQKNMIGKDNKDQILYYFPTEEIPRNADIQVSIIGETEETLNISLSTVK